jgi:AraC-like DNA-binding protein
VTHTEMQRMRRADKEHMRHSRDERDRVIIVARPEISRRIARTALGDHVIAFSSLDELDHWRTTARAAEPIGEDVAAALAEVGCTLGALPRKLRDVLEALALETCVPALSAIERRWPSRRSFYRVWTQAIGDPPSAFLRRVQAHHARRLLGIGLTKKEAALLAGFSSVDQMRRHINK